MSKVLYQCSLGLIIFAAIMQAFQGTRYIASPVMAFQIATLVNMVLPFIIGILLVVFLGVRFADVWKGRVDVTMRATRPIARASQTAGKVLLYIFYAMLLATGVFMIMAGGRLQSEIGFLFAPLAKTLPVGLILTELGRILDLRDQSSEFSTPYL